MCGACSNFATPRAPLDGEVEITYKNPAPSTLDCRGDRRGRERQLPRRPSTWGARAWNCRWSSALDNGLGYVKIYSFSDNERLLSVQLWERMMQNLNENGIPGLIIDMRQNGGGGSGFLGRPDGGLLLQRAAGIGHVRLLR